MRAPAPAIWVSGLVVATNAEEVAMTLINNKRRNIGRWFALAVFVFAAGYVPRAVLAAEAPPSAVDKALEGLKSSDTDVSANAAARLGGLLSSTRENRAEDELDRAVRALSDKVTAPPGTDPRSWVARRAAADVLGRIGVYACAEDLKKALRDVNLEVVIAATEALGRILPPDEMRHLMHDKLEGPGHAGTAAARYLGRHAEAEDLAALEGGLSAEDWRTRTHCAAGLAHVAKQGTKLPEETCRKLAEQLGDSTANAANAAKDALIASVSGPAIKAVMAAAQKRGSGDKEDVSWRTRSAAVDVLGRIGIKAAEEHLGQGVEEWFSVVIRGLGDDVLNVSNAAKGALAGVPPGTLYPRLVQAFRANDGPAVRGGVLSAMSRILPEGQKDAAAALAVEALEEAGDEKGAAELRAGALQLLGAAGASGVAEKVAACVMDDSPLVRGSAVMALSRLVLKEEKERAAVSAVLAVGLASDDWRKAAAAARAISNFPSSGAITALIRDGLGHAVVNVQEASVAALLNHSSDPGRKAEVEKVLSAEVDANEMTWEYGAKVMGALRTKDAVPALVRMIRAYGGEGHWRTQLNAIAALAAIGVMNDEVENALRLCEQSEIAQVKAAAQAALRALGR